MVSAGFSCTHLTFGGSDMFTYEIDNILKSYNYNIPSSVYINICRTSPQIWVIKREWDGRYYIQTKDGNEYHDWTISVYKE